jgi:thiol-disulfide isomerase/thioredoxin
VALTPLVGIGLPVLFSTAKCEVSQGYIIRVDKNRTGQMALISSVAEGMVFKKTHLRVGKRVPDLNVKLISGQDWSLAAQAGRVTVIQFSFKGCGPCEAMYPDLREIQQAYGDRVSILSIMADERIEDTREAVSSGKMTWNVHWDGFRGPLATRWAVDSFPAVYVVDEHGLVAAARSVRGERLKNMVASLLK